MSIYTAILALVFIIAVVGGALVAWEATVKWLARKDAELQAHIDAALNSDAAEANIEGYGRLGRSENR